MKEDEYDLLLAVASKESPRHAGARLGIHPKRVDSICAKWTRKEWYAYGVTVDLGWLTEAGLKAVHQATAARVSR